jgi:hypothetical protein
LNLADSGARLPCVLDLFGTGGGLIEHRAALLANCGYAVLALAYFDYPDLPEYLADLDLNYFRVNFVVVKFSTHWETQILCLVNFVFMFH